MNRKNRNKNKKTSSKVSRQKNNLDFDNYKSCIIHMAHPTKSPRNENVMSSI